MSASPRFNISLLRNLFALSGISFLIVYLLRGLKILTFIPGIVIVFLLVITLISGIIWGIWQSKRF